jgi:putative hemolysin
MTIDDLLWVLLALAGLGGSALWSGTETGMYSVSRVRLAIRRGDPRDTAARTLAGELAHPDRTLGTILIGNNVCNYLGTLGLTAVLEARGFSAAAMFVLQIGVLTPVLLVFGESLPKEMFRVKADTLTYRVVPVLRAARVLFTVTGVLPLVALVSALASKSSGRSGPTLARPGRERLAELMRESASSGAISTEQARMAERALAFGARRVREVMVPWSGVVAVHEGWSRARVITSLARGDHTRVPVLGPTGAVCGVADRLALQADAGLALSDVTGEAVWLDPGLGLRDALGALRSAGVPIGLVGTPGRPLGIATVKDLLEPLTGELRAW